MQMEKKHGHLQPLEPVPVRIGTIDEYPSPSQDPLLYPGVRLEASFVLDSKDVFAVDACATEGQLQFSMTDSDGRTFTLDDFLRSKDAVQMADRIPIIGYGANMCPASIYSKFEKIGRKDSSVVPTIYGQLKGYDVIWSGGPGVNGNFIANLYCGAETKDTEVTIGVNFLTPEQILVMHGTELSYDLTAIDVMVDNILVKALVYAGVDDILIRDGRPVAVSAAKAEGRALEESDTRTLLGDMLSKKEVTSKLVEHGITSTTADGYVSDAKELKGTRGARLIRKKTVHEQIRKLGLSKSYQLPVDESQLQSWANPSTLPTYGERNAGVSHKNIYRLPHQELPRDRWSNGSRREAVLRSMTTHLIRTSGGELRERDTQ